MTTRFDTNAIAVPQTPYTPGNRWSTIQSTPEYLAILRQLVHDEDTLKKNGYIVAPLGKEDVELKKRCKNCRGHIKKKPSTAPTSTKCFNCKITGHTMLECKLPRVDQEQLERNKKEVIQDKSKSSAKIKLSDDKKPNGSNVIDEDKESRPLEKPKSENQKNGKTERQTAEKSESQNKGKGQQQTAEMKAKKPTCQYHPGALISRRFTCCRSYMYSDGCMAADHHEPTFYYPGQLETEWKFHVTPEKPTSTIGNPAVQLSNPWYPPYPTLSTGHALAIAFDCEMGVSRAGESELIRVSAVEYFTGTSLVDALVMPSVPIANFNTKYSGVSASDMELALHSGKCILGRDAARFLLCGFVGPETVVVTHGGCSDFTVLRWMHQKTADTHIVEKLVEREVPLKGGLSLKSLCQELLGREVQSKKKIGHCSKEDALAARELMHWYVSHIVVGEGTTEGSDLRLRHF